MISCILITLKGHPPSKEAQQLVDFYLKDLNQVSCSNIQIGSRVELLAYKKEYKFEDLPLLIVPIDHRGIMRSAKRLTDRDEITVECQRLNAEFMTEKRRRLSGIKVKKK